MENFNQTIDLDLVQESQTYQDVSKGTRFANLIIDTIVTYLLYFVIVFLIFLTETVSEENWAVLYLLFYVQFIAYYILMEAALGKTVGKMITKTKVIHENGTQAPIANIIGRTFARFIPFEALSFFGNKGWHDSLSGTRVVKEN